MEEVQEINLHQYDYDNESDGYGDEYANLSGSDHYG